MDHLSEDGGDGGRLDATVEDVESRDSSRPTLHDFQRFMSSSVGQSALVPPPLDFRPQPMAIPTLGPPPRVLDPATFLNAPRTQPEALPLPPPFVEPAGSGRKTLAPQGIAPPEFPDSDEIETFVLSPSDPVPVGWTSFFIEATDGEGSTLHVENEDDLLANGLRQIRLNIGKEVRHVIVPIGMANTNEVNIGVRRLIKALFNKYPDGFSFRFLVPRSSPKL